MKIVKTTKPLKILHFDTESRPLSWKGQDYVTSEITAIATSWADDDKVYCWMLGMNSPFHMLSMFTYLWKHADIVTGHYCRKHDIPRINAMLLEHHMPPLSSVYVSDTCSDLLPMAAFTKAQGELGELYALAEEKKSMSTLDWRAGNRLQAKGLKDVRLRVMDDVRQHKALRRKLTAGGWLKPPTLWKGE